MPRPTVHRHWVESVTPVTESTEEGLSYDELYALAKERKIKGRSDMTKDELIAALGES